LADGRSGWKAVIRSSRLNVASAPNRSFHEAEIWSDPSSTVDKHISKPQPRKGTYSVAMAGAAERARLNTYGRAEISFGVGFLHDIAFSLDHLV
jgi:hypothetical protein